MGNIISLVHSFTRASSFEALLQPHVDVLYRYAFRLSGNVADAEDLVQDLLVKLYPRRRELTKIEKIRPWLFKVLYRLFIDQRRQASRNPLHLVVNEEKNDSLQESFDQTANEHPDAAAIMEGKQLQHLLLKAVHGLNPDQRHVCVLHDIEGYALQEIVDILEIPLGTVKSRLHRARENLRKKINWGTNKDI
jgi:RNA polymerase sigma-70 factor (ECF subfamily)